MKSVVLVGFLFTFLPSMLLELVGLLLLVGVADAVELGSSLEKRQEILNEI